VERAHDAADDPFANLRPGRYRFLVRAVTSDGTVSAAPSTVSFTILPPVWLRWWFLTLATIGVGAAIHLAYPVRVARCSRSSV
jgi:hypothetical protein